MRERPSLSGGLIAGWLVLAVVVLLAACSGEPTSGPTLGTIDFDAKLELHVREGAVTASPGPKQDDRVRTDPPTVPSGSVVEIVNDGDREHRLQAESFFDTGIMQPGESTTVVVANPTGADKTVAIEDLFDESTKATFTVLPAPAT